jgi:hypothetical protein
MIPAHTDRRNPPGQWVNPSFDPKETLFLEKCKELCRQEWSGVMHPPCLETPVFIPCQYCSDLARL